MIDFKILPPALLRRITVCFLLFASGNFLLHAQEKLGRKPWFGAQFASNDEGKKTGCLVTRIGGGTSEALKLQN
jgi:hypothetical protein